MRWARGAPSRWGLQRLLTHRLLFLVSISAGILLALRGQPRPDLTVEIAGCDIVRAPPEARVRTACKLGGASALAGAGHGPRGRRLALWIQASPWASVKVWLDGKPVDTARLPTLPGAPEDGAGPVEVDVPEGASELRVTADAAGKIAEARWPLLTQPPSREQAELARVRELRDAGDRDAAERLCEALQGSADPVVGARATALLARLVRGHDPARAHRLYQQALSLDRLAGLISDEVADGFAFTVALLADLNDLRRAGEVLDRIEGLLADVPVGRALAPNYRAMVARARGDLGSALALLDEAEARGHRLDLAGHLSDVYQQKLEVLDLLGRPADALRVQRMLEDPRLASTSPCARANRATNLGWHALLAGTLDEVTRAELAEAANVFGKGCGGPGDRHNVLTILARWAIAAGHLAEAEETLERARREQPDPPALTAAEWGLAYGYLELARDRPEEAGRRFAGAVALCRATGLPDCAVEGDFGLAEALERRGREADALAAYAAADAQLDRWSVVVPLGAGKQTFLGRYQRGVRRYLELLVRRAEETEDPRGAEARQAVCTARRNRARMRVFAEWQHRLAAAPPDRRADLDRALMRRAAVPHDGGDPHASESGVQAALALDEAAHALAGPLVPQTCDEPAGDEVLLVYHPLPSGWAGFAVTREGVAVRRIAVDDAAIRAWQARVTGPEPAVKLLWPFADVLDDEGLHRLRFLPAEPLAQVDLHRLSWSGAPLSQRFSVTYGVDTFRPRLPAGAPPHRKTALVVAITGRAWNLYMTGAEAKAVEAALDGDGWRVVSLDSETATRDEVKRILADDDVELFHYAGHGFRRGRDAWESYLTLAHDERLTMADVLGLAHVPRRVILSSCETDAAGDGAVVAGLGLAPAFVLAGADTAVAMRADPKDFLMKAVMSELYTRHFPRFLDDPAVALHETMTALARDLHGVEPPPLRVLVP